MHEHELVKHAIRKGQILFVCTSCNKVGDRTGTGAWVSELAVPYYIFEDNGYDVTLCSLHGGEIPIDEVSRAEQDSIPEVRRFMHDDGAMLQLRQSVPLSSVKDPSAYAAVYLAGGQGAMGDMPQHDLLGDLVTKTAAAGRIVAAVCHGPAGLLSAKGADGKPLVAGRTIACYTEEEEEATGAKGAMPFQLESKLKELGATVRAEPVATENALRDGLLITGQNHQSAARVASLVLEALSVHPAGPEEPIVGRAAGAVAEARG